MKTVHKILSAVVLGLTTCEMGAILFPGEGILFHDFITALSSLILFSPVFFAIICTLKRKTAMEKGKLLAIFGFVAATYAIPLFIQLYVFHSTDNTTTSILIVLASISQIVLWIKLFKNKKSVLKPLILFSTLAMAYLPIFEYLMASASDIIKTRILFLLLFLLLATLLCIFLPPFKALRKK